MGEETMADVKLIPPTQLVNDTLTLDDPSPEQFGIADGPDHPSLYSVLLRALLASCTP